MMGILDEMVTEEEKDRTVPEEKSDRPSPDVMSEMEEAVIKMFKEGSLTSVLIMHAIKEISSKSHNVSYL